MVDASAYSESFITENTPEDFDVKREEVKLENYRVVLDENLRLKSSEKQQLKRSKTIIGILSLFIIITTSILITVFILKADVIFQSCENGNKFIYDSVEEMKMLHDRTHRIAGDVFSYIDFHERNQDTRTKDIVNKGSGSFVSKVIAKYKTRESRFFVT
jgi:hypothetical protein